jgi:hypothetical protein
MMRGMKRLFKAIGWTTLTFALSMIGTIVVFCVVAWWVFLRFFTE